MGERRVPIAENGTVRLPEDWESQLLARKRGWELPSRPSEWSLWFNWLAKGFIIFAAAYLVAEVIHAIKR